MLSAQHIGSITLASASFKLFAPRLYDHYHARTMGTVMHLPHLKMNFMRSIFATSAFNFGPQVVTRRHRDCMNCPYGWCGVHAMGDYDHTQGGHMVLEEAKLVIEFPPATLILIPSAVFTHSNTGIQTDETRLSFTQYTPGAIFRYYDNGFRTDDQFKADDEEGYLQAVAARATRWETGLSLWSTVDELLGEDSLSDRRNVKIVYEV